MKNNLDSSPEDFPISGAAAKAVVVALLRLLFLGSSVTAVTPGNDGIQTRSQDLWNQWMMRKQRRQVKTTLP